MGTYSKPELINVNPLSGLQAGIDKGFAGIAAGKTARKAREAKQASINKKDLEKKLKEKKKQIADAEDLRQDLFSLDQLDVKSFQSKFKGFAMDLIDVDLMKHEYGSTEWSEAEARIEKYIKRSNRAIEVLETEKQDWINAHEKDPVTGAWKLRENGTTGSRLIGGDEKEQDMWYVMDALMMREGEGVEFSSGKNGGAVGITLEHPDNKVAKMYAAGAGSNLAGTPMMDQNGKPIFEYLKEGHPDYKEPIVLNFSEYLKKKDLGDNLINTLSSESRTKAIDASWKSLSKAYDDDEQTIKTETAVNGKIETSTLVSYAQADKNLVANITNNVDDYIPDDDKKAQNIWQQMSAAKTQKIQPSKTKFNRNNPEHRAIYAAGYAAEMKSRHGKRQQLSKEQTRQAVQPDDIYFNKIKNKGVEVPWAGILEEQTSYIGQDAIFIEAADNNGTAVTVGEMIENGNVTYGLVDAIATDLVEQIGTKGDDEYGVSVSNTLASMLNNTPNARLKGVTYQPGQEVLEGLNDTYAGMVSSMKSAYANTQGYKDRITALENQLNSGAITKDQYDSRKLQAALLPGTKDVNGDNVIDFNDMLLCVAQGDVIKNPNPDPGNVDDWPKNVCAWDPRSWPAGMDPATSTLPNFGGATDIKNGGLFETSGSKAKVILDLKNVDKKELISDIIFDTLPINKATKNKIKTGYSTYKNPQTTQSKSGSRVTYATKKEAEDFAKANGGVVKQAVDKTFYVN